MDETASRSSRSATPNTPVGRDERITTAALDLLRTKGPRAVTVEAVAARAEVAKTTIYRRYRDREDMLAAALTSLTQPTPPADRSALLPILQWLVQQSLNAIEAGIGVGGVAALLTGEDPDFTELIRSLLVEHRGALANVVRDASLGYEVREDLDVETLLDCIVGAYLAERARSGVVQPGWAKRVLHTLWPAFTPTPPNGP
jgi:AcrR family transcriptional regulator